MTNHPPVATRRAACGGGLERRAANSSPPPCGEGLGKRGKESDCRETGAAKHARCLAIALALCAVAISAAIAGSPEEDFRSGLSAFNGGDFAGAMRLWRPLADRNDARAQAGIGFMYHRGLGVKTDDAQAAFWLRKAAEQGQAEGQLMLGSLYFFGLGVPQS